MSEDITNINDTVELEKIDYYLRQISECFSVQHHDAGDVWPGLCFLSPKQYCIERETGFHPLSSL